jgi:hypothetical protein
MVLNKSFTIPLTMDDKLALTPGNEVNPWSFSPELMYSERLGPWIEYDVLTFLAGLKTLDYFMQDHGFEPQRFEGDETQLGKACMLAVLSYDIHGGINLPKFKLYNKDNFPQRLNLGLEVHANTHFGSIESDQCGPHYVYDVRIGTVDLKIPCPLKQWDIMLSHNFRYAPLESSIKALEGHLEQMNSYKP